MKRENPIAVTTEGSNHWGMILRQYLARSPRVPSKIPPYEHRLPPHRGITANWLQMVLRTVTKVKLTPMTNGKLGIQSAIWDTAGPCVAMPATNIAFWSRMAVWAWLRAELCRSCYDGNRRKVGNEHGQDVLEAEGDDFGDWHPSLQFINIVDTAIGYCCS